jgi:hypothetical protein
MLNNIVFGCLLVGLAIVFIVLIATFSNENDQSSPGLLAMVFGFSLFVGIAAFCLTLAYFQPKPEEMVGFLLFLTLVVIFPACLSSTAMSVTSIRNLRETLASA